MSNTNSARGSLTLILVTVPTVVAVAFTRGKTDADASFPLFHRRRRGG